MYLQNSLYASSSLFSSILAVGAHPNSTFDLYIELRLSDEARRKLIYHNPHTENIHETKVNPNGCLVIINRYVTGELIRWLEQNRSNLAGILWLLDDDLTAMVFGCGVPLLNRVKPTTTLCYQNRLKALSAHVIVSTKRLAALYRDWSVIIMPPIAHIPTDNRPLNPHRLYYFAKMHSPEHAFLYPVVRDILRQHSQVQFTVTANGQWAKKWAALDRVNVTSELSYSEYLHFLQTLPTGGIFLVPLTHSWLNASRSSAKLIDVARSGSTALIADHPAYRKFLMAKSVKEIGMKGIETDGWRMAIETHINAKDIAQKGQETIKNYINNTYRERQIIV